MKESKKKKWERHCYNCKFEFRCSERYKVKDHLCDNFEFSSLCKSM